MSARVARLCDCKACRSRRAKARSNWCHFVIDADAVIDDVPHQVVLCGKRNCTEHPISGDSGDQP